MDTTKQGAATPHDGAAPPWASSRERIAAEVVLRAPNGAPLVLDYEGALWEHPSGGAEGQERLRERLADHDAREQLAALVPPAQREAFERLLREVTEHSELSYSGEVDELWKKVGIFLCGAGFPTLWRALFQRYCGEYGLCESGDYQPNDEWRFLYGASWQSALRRWCPAIQPDPEPPVAIPVEGTIADIGRRAPQP
jgi:hypothetical protein